jgi:hypothetical protein
MRYVGPIGKIVLPLIFGLGLLLATAEDRELAALNFFQPATLVRFATNRVRALQTYVRDLRLSHSLPADPSNEHIPPNSPPPLQGE